LNVTTLVDGKLTEARFVIFARGPSPANNPENNLANIYGYPMEFHVWSDGIEGGADSFDQNPRGFTVPGHIDIDVNTPTASHITVAPFGHTGPPQDPNMFVTFLVRIDLSSFDIVLDGGTEYVMGIFQDNESNFVTGGGFFRISASLATGFEDVFRAFNTNPSLRPGYVNSQHAFGYEQFAGSFTLAPLLDGDYDFDNDVDGADFLKWQAAFGSDDSQADGNDDGLVDGEDLAIWASHFGEAASAAGVPEPSAAARLSGALAFALRRAAGFGRRDHVSRGLIRPRLRAE
jgi:hypothetical protein